ncbi:hypothetical protein [Microvirga lenta]|uniref:hypothetical protein n=1 Tax=Microvirga lenta TaxID=2881337 RepID=UPI001CFEF0F5|nr:hypothetical protein [Microvirga lenta]MCB5173686.1 hypothetical protein [Microvirga lenta]
MSCTHIILFTTTASFLIGGIVGAYLVHALAFIGSHAHCPSDETAWGDYPNVEGR